MTEEEIMALKAENAALKAEVKLANTKIDYYKGVLDSVVQSLDQLLDVTKFVVGGKK